MVDWLMVGVVGVGFTVVGAVFAVFPYAVTLRQVQQAAVGSRRGPAEAEPAEWNVTLTKVAGIVSILFGLAACGGSVLVTASIL